MQIVTRSFFISRQHFCEALDRARANKRFFQHVPVCQYNADGTIRAMQKLSRVAETASSIHQLLAAVGFQTEIDEAGTIVDISLSIPHYQIAMLHSLRCLAPYIKSGSYLEFTNEKANAETERCLWEWDGAQMLESHLDKEGKWVDQWGKSILSHRRQEAAGSYGEPRDVS